MKCVTAYISVAILFIVQEFSARATYNKCMQTQTDTACESGAHDTLAN